MNISKSAGHAEYEWAVKWNRYPLDIAGIWPEEDVSARTKFLANLRLLAVLLAIVCGCTVPTVLELIMIRSNTMAVIENLQFSLPLVTTVVKTIVLWWKKRDLAPIIGMIENDWVKSKTIEERNVMIRRMLLVRRFNYCLYTMMVLACAQTSVLPGFGISLGRVSNTSNRVRLLPVGGCYLYDVTVSPNYELAFLAQILGIASCGLCYAAVDTLFGLLILHVSGQLENLMARLTDMKNCPHFDYAFAFNINDHIRIVRSIEIIDSTFNVLFLVLFLYLAGFICVYGFLVFTVFDERSNVTTVGIMYLIVNLVAITSITCLYCIVGQILINQSERFYNVVCDYGWDDLEPRKARNFILLIARASTPLYVTAGKLFPVTMPTFCSFIKMSVGYISFLLTTVK